MGENESSMMFSAAVGAWSDLAGWLLQAAKSLMIAAAYPVRCQLVPVLRCRRLRNA